MQRRSKLMASCVIGVGVMDPWGSTCPGQIPHSRAHPQPRAEGAMNYCNAITDKKQHGTENQKRPRLEKVVSSAQLQMKKKISARKRVITISISFNIYWGRHKMNKAYM